MQTERSTLTRGYLIAAISAGILSTTAILIRYLTQTYQIPAMVLAFWRDVFAVITLMVVLGVLRSNLLWVSRRRIPFLIIYGLILAFFNALWTLSVALNGAAVATVLVYSSVGFTAVLGWWLLQERLDVPIMFAVGVSLGGCVLVSGAWNPNMWGANLVGILTGLFSGLGYALYSLMGRSASKRELNPWTTILYTFAFAAVFLLLYNLVPAILPGVLPPGAASTPVELLWLENDLAGWGILFLLAAGPTVGGFGLYNVSLGYLPSSVANLILTLEPVFTGVTAYLLLGERLSWVEILGSLLVMGAVIFLRVYQGRLARKKRLQAGEVAEVIPPT